MIGRTEPESLPITASPFTRPTRVPSTTAISYSRLLPDYFVGDLVFDGAGGLFGGDDVCRRSQRRPFLPGDIPGYPDKPAHVAEL